MRSSRGWRASDRVLVWVLVWWPVSYCFAEPTIEEINYFIQRGNALRQQIAQCIDWKSSATLDCQSVRGRLEMNASILPPVDPAVLPADDEGRISFVQQREEETLAALSVFLFLLYEAVSLDCFHSASAKR